MSGRNTPALARAMISLLATEDLRAPLIGDLEEEFAQRSANAANASAWYWRQTLTSFPSLAWRRLSSAAARRAAVLLGLTAFAYFAITAWQENIAVPLTRALFESAESAPVNLVRAFFIAVHMAGVAIAAAVIAGLLFKREDSFIKNAIWRLGPLAATLILPIVVVMAFTADTYPIWFRLMWLTAAIPSLLLGAWAGSRFLSRPKR